MRPSYPVECFAFDVAFPPLFFHERKEEKLVNFEKKKKKRIVIVLSPLCNMYRVDGSFVDARATGWKSFHDRETGWRMVNGGVVEEEEEEVPLLSSAGWGGNVAMGKRGVDNEIRLGRELEELRSDDSRKV